MFCARAGGATTSSNDAHGANLVMAASFGEAAKFARRTPPIPRPIDGGPWYGRPCHERRKTIRVLPDVYPLYGDYMEYRNRRPDRGRPPPRRRRFAGFKRGGGRGGFAGYRRSARRSRRRTSRGGGR